MYSLFHLPSCSLVFYNRYIYIYINLYMYIHVHLCGLLIKCISFFFLLCGFFVFRAFPVLWLRSHKSTPPCRSSAPVPAALPPLPPAAAGGPWCCRPGAGLRVPIRSEGWLLECHYRSCFSLLGVIKVRKWNRLLPSWLSLGNILHFCLLWFSGKSTLSC